MESGVRGKGKQWVKGEEEKAVKGETKQCQPKDDKKNDSKKPLEKKLFYKAIEEDNSKY